MKRSLPKALVAAREAQELSQAQLASKLEVAAGTVAGWELGTHVPAIKHWRSISKVLEVDVGDYVGAAA